MLPCNRLPSQFPLPIKNKSIMKWTPSIPFCCQQADSGVLTVPTGHFHLQHYDGTGAPSLKFCNAELIHLLGAGVPTLTELWCLVHSFQLRSQNGLLGLLANLNDPFIGFGNKRILCFLNDIKCWYVLALWFWMFLNITWGIQDIHTI